MARRSVSHDEASRRLDHRIDAMCRIEEDVADITFKQFAGDRRRVDAVLWNLQVIGEAVRLIPEELRERHPHLPWRLMRSLRNVIVHQYEQIRLDLVWEAVKTIPQLRADLQHILRAGEDEKGP